MRVLIVANGFPPSAFGGVEVYCSDLAHELSRRGHTVKVFSRESDQTQADGTIRTETVGRFQVVRVVNDYKRLVNFRQTYQDQRIEAIFAEQLEAFKPDLVHFNHLIALSTGLPAVTRQKNIPSVLTLHDYWSFCYRINLLTSSGALCSGFRPPEECQQCVFVQVGQGSRKYRLAKLLKPVLPHFARLWLSRKIHYPGDPALLIRSSVKDFAARERAMLDMLRQANQLVVPSEFVRSLIAREGLTKDRIAVVPLGIGFQSKGNRSLRNGSTLHIGFVGSVIPTKGVESLIKAFRQVPGEHVQLDIYGREDVQPLFSRHLHDLAEGDARIVFHGGFSPDQREAIFSQLDVFVMPSIWHETFSFVAREALQAGIPVIAARVGALTEIIHEGVNGYLYNAGDEQALASLIRKIAQAPEQLKALHAPGPIEIISVSEHVNRIEQVYTAVVNA